MRETFEQYISSQPTAQQRNIATKKRESLARYRYHTGATLTPLLPDEVCPVLFRDIGSVATARFLQGQLTRLAGPTTPITYMRTEHYVEPYTDYDTIGRIVLLRPTELSPWHAGVDHIYVARATHMSSRETTGYIPGEWTLAQASALVSETHNTDELREALGGPRYDQSMAAALDHLHTLNQDLAESEAKALPLRKMLQSNQYDKRMKVREWMHEHNLDEDDLCRAWHHLPHSRREHIKEALTRIHALHFSSGQPS